MTRFSENSEKYYIMPSRIDEDDLQSKVNLLCKKKYIPFIGPEIRTILWRVAEDWANKDDYPLPDRYNLAGVAQYLAITDTELSPKNRISQQMQESMLLPVYDDLAKLPVEFFVTTNHDDYLIEALKKHHKEPKWCSWKATNLEEYKEYKPDVNSPFVYYLNGCQSDDQIIVTEEDHFNFMFDYFENIEGRMPKQLNSAISNSVWLFLGYDLADWSFRVLLKSLLRGRLTTKMAKIAVQQELSLPSGCKEKENSAREYLKKYCARYGTVEVCWCGVHDFVKHLLNQIQDSTNLELSSSKPIVKPADLRTIARLIINKGVSTPDEQRALLIGAWGSGHPFINQITLGGSAENFANNLIENCVNYDGDFKADDNVLYLILEYLKNNLGMEKREYINELQEKLFEIKGHDHRFGHSKQQIFDHGYRKSRTFNKEDQ
ncbi:MAG: SIR2 family protein [Candidatus Competibacteraceae bacterium]